MTQPLPVARWDDDITCGTISSGTISSSTNNKLIIIDDHRNYQTFINYSQPSSHSSIQHASTLTSDDSEIQQFWNNERVLELFQHSDGLHDAGNDLYSKAMLIRDQFYYQYCMLALIWMKTFYNAKENNIRVPTHNDIRPIIINLEGGSLRAKQASVISKCVYVINKLVRVLS